MELALPAGFAVGRDYRSDKFSGFPCRSFAGTSVQPEKDHHSLPAIA